MPSFKKQKKTQMLGSNPGPHVCVTSVSLTKAFPWPLKQCFGVEKLLLSQRPTHSLQQNNNNKKIIQKHNYLKKGLKIHFFYLSTQKFILIFCQIHSCQYTGCTNRYQQLSSQACLQQNQLLLSESQQSCQEISDSSLSVPPIHSI